MTSAQTEVAEAKRRLPRLILLLVLLVALMLNVGIIILGGKKDYRKYQALRQTLEERFGPENQEIWLQESPGRWLEQYKFHLHSPAKENSDQPPIRYHSREYRMLTEQGGRRGSVSVEVWKSREGIRVRWWSESS